MNTIDLFAGCGGMSMGFENAGFNILKAYDNWQEAINCYRMNLSHPIENIDLNDVDKIVNELDGLKIDVIIGGPPCQDFSHAGKRKEGKKATLTEKFAEIVVRIKPKWYVMENVDRTRKSIAYKNAREILSEAGYGITETVLDASKCGVPQRRRRFFSIGHLNNSNNFLVRQLKEKQRIKSLTPREYFDNKFPVDFFYRHPRNYNRRGIFSIDEPSPTIRGVNRPLPPGYKGHKNDPIEVSDQVRALTTEERAWIQTFPKNFKLLGTKTVNEQLIGNAVPVKLAEFVGKIILKYEETKCQNEVPALVN